MALALDPTFGSGGAVSPGFGTQLALQPDGRILVAGETDGAIAVARYLPDGTPDSAFGTAGVARLAPDSGTLAAAALAVDAQGRILVAGTRSTIVRVDPVEPYELKDVALLRFTPDGAPDAAFGTGGLVLTKPPGDHEFITDVLPLPDGRAVVVGSHVGGPRAYVDGRETFALRFNADGTPDATFGQSGFAAKPVTVSHEVAGGAALQPDGKLVVAVGAEGYDPDGRLFGRLQLVRIDTAGAIDPTFAAGETPSDAPAYQWPADLAIRPDGSFVLAGRGGPPRALASGITDDFAVASYLPDGSPDSRFGDDGHVVTNVGEHHLDRPSWVPANTAASEDAPAAVALRPDGGVVVVGRTTAGGDQHSRSFALAAYDWRGRPDNTVGRGGVAVRHFGDGGPPDAADPIGSAGLDVAFAPDGAILALANASPAPLLVRFRTRADPVRRSPRWARLTRAGTLRVRGTGGPDRITVTRARPADLGATPGIDVTLNGVTRTFEAADVRRITVSGRGGDDDLSADAALTLPVSLLGGAGNDVLAGGGGDDTLAGGAGNDLFTSRDTSADQLLGGPGADIATKDPRDTARTIELLLA
jgi:uncharacterized delta-60 repeat protein